MVPVLLLVAETALALVRPVGLRGGGGDKGQKITKSKVMWIGIKKTTSTPSFQGRAGSGK